jgi:hypothetical protein
MTSSSEQPEGRAHVLCRARAALLDECRALRCQLETVPTPTEGTSAESVPVLRFEMTSALELALTRALQNVLTVLPPREPAAGTDRRGVADASGADA